MVTQSRERTVSRPKTATKCALTSSTKVINHNQHIEKCISGSGIYFGFRGAKEHTMLKIEDVSVGPYPKGSKFEGYLYFAVANLVDKTHALSAENGYRRDTTTLMKVPILSDDPTSGDYGGTLKRMLDKALPGQKRFYHQMKKMVLYL